MRSFPTECVIHKIVLGRRGKIFDASYDVIDCHKMVVDYVGKIIGRHTVRLYENIVLHILVGYADMTEYHIVVFAHSLRGNILSYDVRFACVKTSLHFFLAERKTMLVVLGYTLIVL